MRTLRQAFLALQAALPAVPAGTKLSKLDVLVLATSYIAHLTRTLGHELPGPAWPPFLRGLCFLHPLKVGHGARASGTGVWGRGILDSGPGLQWGVVIGNNFMRMWFQGHSWSPQDWGVPSVRGEKGPGSRLVPGKGNRASESPGCGGYHPLSLGLLWQERCPLGEQ